jgi:hypothetical protein
MYKMRGRGEGGLMMQWTMVDQSKIGPAKNEKGGVTPAFFADL